MTNGGYVTPTGTSDRSGEVSAPLGATDIQGWGCLPSVRGTSATPLGGICDSPQGICDPRGMSPPSCATLEISAPSKVFYLPSPPRSHVSHWWISVPPQPQVTALPQSICFPPPWGVCDPLEYLQFHEGYFPLLCDPHQQHLLPTVVLPPASHRDPVVSGARPFPLCWCQGIRPPPTGGKEKQPQVDFGCCWPQPGAGRMNPSCMRGWGGEQHGHERRSRTQQGARARCTLLHTLSAAQSAAFPHPVISGQGLCCAPTFEMSCAGPTAPGAQLPPR